MADTSRLMIKGGRVYSPDRDPHNPPVADVYIQGTEIVAIAEHGSGGGAPAAPQGFDTGGAEIVNASEKLVMPGFVNAHYHSHDVFLKGFFEPSPLELWVLNVLPRNFSRPSTELLRVRTLLGAMECIRSGITTMQDMVTLSPPDPEHVEAVVSAYDEIGMRVVLGLQVIDVSPLDTTPYWREVIPKDRQELVPGSMSPEMAQGLTEFIEDQCLKARDGASRLTWTLTPSGPERTSRPILERMAGFAETHDLPVYTHLYTSKAEAVHARRSYQRHGGSLVRFLDDVGLLTPRLTVVHGVWLLAEEIEALAEAGCSFVHNPVSNLKNKNGVAPLRKLIEAGVNLALGCDNCSCTDAQNMFQAMKMFCLLAAVTDPRPGPPGAVDAIAAATAGGARTARLDASIGALRPGMKADIAILDLTEPSFVPLNSVARQLVYAEGGAGVETVIIDGRVVMRERRLTTIDEAALREAVDDVMASFRPEAQEVIERNGTLSEYILEADRRIWEHDVGAHRYVGS